MMIYSKHYALDNKRLGADFSKAPVTKRARKAIFNSSVFQNGLHAPYTSSMPKGTSVPIKIRWIKQLCKRKVRDFAMALLCWAI